MELKLVTVVLALALGVANAATVKKDKASEGAFGKKELKNHARYLGEAFDYYDFADVGSVLDCMVYSMKGDGNDWVYVILPLFEQCLCNMGYIDCGDDGYDYSSYDSRLTNTVGIVHDGMDNEYGQNNLDSADYDSPEYPSGSPSNYPSGSPSNYPSGSPSNYPSGSPSNYPSGSPSNYPSGSPSNDPSNYPSNTGEYQGVYPSNNPSFRSFGYSWSSYYYYSGSDSGSDGYYTSDDYYSGCSATKRHVNARAGALRRRHFARKEGQTEHIAARGEGGFGHVKKGHQVNGHQNQAKRIQEILSQLKNLKTHKE